MFALVQGRIRLTHHPCRQSTSAERSKVLQGANSEAGSDGKRLRRDLEMHPGDPLTQAPGNQASVLGGGIRKHHGKLFPAESCDPVFTDAQVTADTRGKLPQDS